MQVETVTGYRFRPDELKAQTRLPGISAFLRTRNGADFVEATIRSHIEFYDEIVAVYNNCEDNTAEILARLAQEFAPKLRVFHYTDRVQPLGSKGHAETPGDHPESMVNYSNFALAMTQHSYVVKLDDDHLAIPNKVVAMCKGLRNGNEDPKLLHCISGLNIARGQDDRLGVPDFDPVSGGGDIGYFQQNGEIYFHHDPRFERFGRAGLQRRFAGYFYWHLKFLKTGGGFRNYELDDNPESRFARKQERFNKATLLDLSDVVEKLRPRMGARVFALVSDKHRLSVERDAGANAMFGDETLSAALDRLSPGWRFIDGLGR